MSIPITNSELRYRLQHFNLHSWLHSKTAKIYLEERLVTYQLLALYQHFFPEQYQNSSTSLYEQYHPNGHRLKEIEALEHLATLIPINESDIELAGERILNHLPLFDMGLDLTTEECCLESLDLPLQLLLPLSQVGRDCLVNLTGEEWYETSFGFSLDCIRPPESALEPLLRQRFNREPLPVRFLPLVLRLMDKTTGNPWLDCSLNDYGFGERCNLIAPWTIPTFQMLIRKWHQAELLLKQTAAFIDWMNADSTPRFEQILRLWNPPT